MRSLLRLAGVVFIFVAYASSSYASPVDDYMSQRNQLVQSEGDQKIGGKLVLSAAEKIADEVIMRAKQQEMPPIRIVQLSSMHFFDAQPGIERSDLFALLRPMPKGAALHVHSDSNVPVSWVIANATYDDNLHVCGSIGETGSSFRYTEGTPAMPCPTGWQQVNQLRNATGTKAFDQVLLEAFTLINQQRPPYVTLDAVWDKFQAIFGATSGIVFYDEVHTRYTRELLRSFKEDGISHLEIRQVFMQGIGQTYALNGTVYSTDHVVTKIQRLASEVGISVRLIVCSMRLQNPSVIAGVKAETARLMKAFPGFVVGFDLVGQEDLGDPLRAFIPQLLEGPSVPFFFHAGETNDVDGEADENLVDAVLLNSTRIGHGFGLSRHPDLRSMVKKRSIGIEVCPLSNQVLMLVEDLRNHPLVQFSSEDLPLTISPDDGALWGAKGVSYDWFQFFLASGNNTGLAFLKQLAINSLQYSVLLPAQKKEALKQWNQAWDAYVQWLVSQR